MGNVNVADRAAARLDIRLLTPHGERERGAYRRDPPARKPPNPSWGT